MNKAKILYLQDHNGNQPALDTILRIAKKATNRDDLYFRLLRLIRLGLRDIEKHGVLEWDNFREYQFVTTGERGYLVTLNLIKRLDHNRPLFEFRVNQKRFPSDQRDQGYAFRMIFFTHAYKDLQYICCTNSLIKRSKTSQEFNRLIVKSRSIFDNFQRNPKKYIFERMITE